MRTSQRRVEETARLHHGTLSRDGIQNLAVLVVETRTGKVRAWVGSHDFYDSRHGGQVDGVRAERSTGSLLKPFLAAKALDRGPYTMQSKIQDVPTFFGTFAPQNASKEFSGLVSLEDVLVQSLNVPSVRLLNAYGVRDFYDFLAGRGTSRALPEPRRVRSRAHPRGRRGESLRARAIVCGARKRRRIRPVEAIERTGREWSRSRKASEPPSADRRLDRSELFSKGAAWLVLNTLTRLSRPGSEYYWEYFDNRVPVAWKTGTSYGQKDAWAIGVNRQWTIGVWAGNFTGEGNAMLTGHAFGGARFSFSLFNQLTRPGENAWFDDPLFDLAQVECCAESGFPAGPDCPHKISLKRPQDLALVGDVSLSQAFPRRQSDGTRGVLALLVGCRDRVDHTLRRAAGVRKRSSPRRAARGGRCPDTHGELSGVPRRPTAWSSSTPWTGSRSSSPATSTASTRRSFSPRSTRDPRHISSGISTGISSARRRERTSARSISRPATTRSPSRTRTVSHARRASALFEKRDRKNHPAMWCLIFSLITHAAALWAFL